MSEVKTQGHKATGAVRLFGVNIPAGKKIKVGLPVLYGVGKNNVFDICSKLGIDPEKRMYELNEDQLQQITKYIDESVDVEGELRAKVSMNIKRLISINCYKGTRHRKGLPVRGQRTKTNARTRKGKKSGPIAGKKKVAK